MTQLEIYNLLWYEVYMKCAFKVGPHSPANFLEQASRKAHIYAVQNTWYWFNNQATLMRHAMYANKESK